MVRIYDLIDESWNLIKEFNAPINMGLINRTFGRNISLSGDGSTLAIGSSRNSDRDVEIYQMTNIQNDLLNYHTT